MESVSVYVVLWRHKFNSYSIDFDTERMAQSFALRLAEGQRTDVMVFARDFEPDPAHMAAVKERVWRALRGHAMGEAMREAAR